MISWDYLVKCIYIHIEKKSNAWIPNKDKNNHSIEHTVSTGDIIYITVNQLQEIIVM